LTMPTQVLWGTGDVFFDLSWAHWLHEQIPGNTRVVELADARLFFPLEHSQVLAGLLDEFWTG
jgi:pimeloyl-ACP methyl ester carboxylesterase